METQTGEKVKCWHSDNGGEFISKVMEDINKSNGIIHEPTAPYITLNKMGLQRGQYIQYRTAQGRYLKTLT